VWSAADGAEIRNQTNPFIEIGPDRSRESKIIRWRLPRCAIRETVALWLLPRADCTTMLRTVQVE